MIYIHDKKVNNIAEFNLLHAIINPPKRAKNINSHHSPILHGCINIRKFRKKFENFRILLDSGCSSAIVMRRIAEKPHPDKYAMMQWHTQAGNITTNNKVKVDFTLTGLSAMNVAMWNCCVD